MRIASHLYPSGGLTLHGPAAFLPDAPAGSGRSPAMRSQLAAAGRTPLPGPYVDLPAIEKQARTMRAQALAAVFSRFLRWLMQSAERARYRELERYLAQSVDLCDLERRIRDVERNPRPVFGPYT